MLWSSETSIRWPVARSGSAPTGSPVARGSARPTSRSRASRPASTETAPNRPLTTSLIATPTFIGRPSGSPVIDIRPPTAWITKS